MSEYRNGPDPWDLEPHYCKHVDAMTGEKLHAKSEIARELAFRDQQIERLTAVIDRLGSNEAFDVATSNVPKELDMRLDFARAALSPSTGLNERSE